MVSVFSGSAERAQLQKMVPNKQRHHIGRRTVFCAKSSHSFGYRLVVLALPGTRFQISVLLLHY